MKRVSKPNKPRFRNGWAIFCQPPTEELDFPALAAELEVLHRDFEEELAKAGSLKIELKEWLTSKEAAHFLGLPVRSLFNLTSNGKVPFYKFGRRIRFKLDEL